MDVGETRKAISSGGSVLELLQIRSVTKTFGALKALDDVSFSLTEGEFLGLIGPNGAGKTTLFNIKIGRSFV